MASTLPVSLVKFPWANKGEEFRIAEMPFIALLQISEIKEKYAQFLSIKKRSQFIKLAEAILGAQRIVEQRGVKDAKDSWDAVAPDIFDESELIGFIWPEEDFTIRLNACADAYVYDRFQLPKVNDQANRQAALDKLNDLGKELVKEWETVKREIGDFDFRIVMLEFYWRLRNSGIKSISTAAGEQVIDWDERKMDDTIQLLAQVVTAADLIALHRADAEAERGSQRQMVNPDNFRAPDHS